MDILEEISREWLKCHQSEHSTVVRKDEDLLFTIHNEVDGQVQATLISVSCPDTEDGKWVSSFTNQC